VQPFFRVYMMIILISSLAFRLRLKRVKGKLIGTERAPLMSCWKSSPSVSLLTPHSIPIISELIMLKARLFINGIAYNAMIKIDISRAHILPMIYSQEMAELDLWFKIFLRDVLIFCC